MIENFTTHPYTRAVCLETARLFEQRAAKHLVEAQDCADQGAENSALEFQTKARVAQQRAHAWYLRAKSTSDERPPHMTVRSSVDAKCRTTVSSGAARETAEADVLAGDIRKNS